MLLVGWWGRDVETVSASKSGIKGEFHHTLPERDILIKHNLSSHRYVCSSAQEVSLSCFISTASWVFCPQISHIPAPLQANFNLLRGVFEACQYARRKESVLRSCAQVGSQGNGKVDSKVEVWSVSKYLWQELLPGGPLSFALKKNICTMKSSKTNPLTRCYCEGLFYSVGRSQS